MRILAVHAKGVMAGGADGVYLHGGRLLAERGHEIAWLTVGRCEPAEELGHPLYSLPEFRDAGQLTAQMNFAIGWIYSRAARRLAERAIDEFKPDVAHMHTIRGTLSPSVALALRKANVPVAQTLHDYRLLCPVNSFLSGAEVCERCKGKRYYQCLRRRCARGRSIVKSAILALSGYVADYVLRYDRQISAYLAPGEFLRQRMIDHGYSANKVHTLHNAFFGAVGEAPAGERSHVLYVGRLAHEKGVDLLVRAAAGLGAPVIVAGDGPERERLEELARDLGADNVRFLGFQPPPVIADLYLRAWVNVLPSRWYENGPLVILEAYARGTPMVGADIGAIPDFLRSGETGYLFRADDAADLHATLRKALADKEALGRMGDTARALVMAEHTPERYADRLEQRLGSMVS